MPENGTYEYIPSSAESGPSLFEGDLGMESDRSQAAELMAHGQAIAVDNDAVWAIWGNSENRQFVDDIRRVKRREPSHGLGLTMPIDDFVTFIDFDRVQPSVRSLLENTGQLTGRLGALAFIRVPGKQSEIDYHQVPDCTVTYTKSKLPTLQNYDPAGKTNIASLLRYAKERKVRYPAVSSLNISGEREIVSLKDAVPFARSHGLPIVADRHALRKGKNSYAIIEFHEAGITLVRKGHIDTSLIQALLHEYKIQIPDNLLPAIAPYDGHDIPGIKDLKGAELRHALIEAFRW